jgi:hypothetical protein
MIVRQKRVFVPRRLPVQLRLAGSDKPLSCATSEIAEDSLIIQGAPTIASGRTVELIFTCKDGTRISVHCVVEPHSGPRLLLRYADLDPATYEQLQDTLWPEWDGRDLLDGLISICRRYRDESLADWVRLTTLLGAIQNRRCRLGRPFGTIDGTFRGGLEYAAAG